MAKLTLNFKGKPIRAYQFDSGDTARIGRNAENEIQIDSLAVGQVHAEIVFGEHSSMIVGKEEDYPVFINNTKTDEHKLEHGDQIGIGKHVLYFTEDSTVLEIPSNTGEEPSLDDDYQQLNEELSQSVQAAEGQLQIMNGKNIGRVISLKGGLTRLGKPETGVAVIAKRKDGFYLASLDADAQIKLNGERILDKSIKLRETDTVEIDSTEMQFFESHLAAEFDDI